MWPNPAADASPALGFTEDLHDPLDDGQTSGLVAAAYTSDLSTSLEVTPKETRR